MAVVVWAVTPMTSETYDAVTAKVIPGDELPEGCQLHIAGPVEQGWRVITVWDSQDAFDRFRQETLLPAIREAMGERPTEVVPEISPVHRLITA
jgi:hypothetical protein